MRAKGEREQLFKVNTSHFGILINGLQSGKTLPSMFLGTFNMLISELDTLITIWTFARYQRGYPFNVTEVPELLYGVRFLWFR